MIMKANELRIGDYFKYGDKTFTVLGIMSDVVLAKSNRGKIDFGIESIEPIPLTEEWLLKFGFRQTNESEDIEWYNLDGFEIAIHEEDGDVYFVYQHMVLRHILYVHQLQNLYFALTGEELLITCK